MVLRGWLRRNFEKVKEEERLFEEEVNRFSIGAPSKILVLPELDQILPKKGEEKNVKQSTDVRYELIPPFAYARIYWSEIQEGLVYEVLQPSLNSKEEEIFEKIRSGLAKSIGVDIEQFSNSKKMLEYIQGEVRSVIDELGIILEPGQYTRLLYYIYINFVGLNEIEPLMHDSYIEDIGCDGVGVPIYITHKKYGNLRTNISYNDVKRLQEFVVKLAERTGRYISYAEPLLDGSLPDGSRIQATLTSDVTTKGPTFSIRKFKEIPYSAPDLIRMKTASSEVMAFLWFAIEHKRNILICGGTGAGKTSFLNSLVSFIPPDDKIVSIEDTRELNLPHENWIPAVSRAGFGTVTKDGTRYGEISMFDLLKESFRQRPDYVVVGEVRGTEASVLFQGMASGHPSLGTIHGGSVDDIIKRMETPPISLPPSLLESLDIVVVITHSDQFGKSARRIKEIAEMENIDSETGRVRVMKSFQWSPVLDVFERHHSTILDRIGAEYGISMSKIEEELKNRQKVLEWLVNKKTFGFMDVSNYLAEYYRNKQKILKAIEDEEAPVLDNPAYKPKKKGINMAFSAPKIIASGDPTRDALDM
ncbi:MAG: type II/IV secretion system ATPase subunit [Nanoarchaeota archaeon]|nr:type II/IV secretion system ATPase subunit [Nanoarchaeota archaeon]MBU4300273.1 type II/IV secretion system ATPase subunit [Nanoarchaeota archaeon]MBU4452514.1 type II/IV secretion system ATPase subunit [Nanoarchaeota archaeon]MCG2723218.1 type II/IV secretion system ATPase subunit [archaeon]